jgi:hypothetical protein
MKPYTVEWKEEKQKNHGVCEIHLPKANARLIAAAPDLLEALRLCITDQGALGYTRPKEYAQRRLDAITEIARAAIAKTTGEGEEMSMKMGQYALQARAKVDVGYANRWRWVFCHNGDKPGSITMTDDYRKAIPAIDLDYFIRKAGHAYDFRVCRITKEVHND